MSSSTRSASTVYLRTLAYISPPVVRTVRLSRPTVHLFGWAVAGVLPEQRQGIAADLDQAGDRAGADLLLEVGGIEVGGDDHRTLRLVALVDDRVQLLQDPVGPLLGPEV